MWFLHIAFTLLLFCRPFVDAQLTVDASSMSVQESGTDCFLRLSLEHFDIYSTLAVVKSKYQYSTTISLLLSSEDIIIQKLFSADSWSMMTKFYGPGAKKKTFFGFEKVHNYAILFQSTIDLEFALNELSLENSWNPHGKVLAYFAGFPKDFDKTMAEVLEIFWRFWVVNVAIVVPVKELKTNVLITYFPFHRGDCGRGKTTYTRIGQCAFGVVEPDHLNVFPNKIPLDLSRCLVKVGAIRNPPFVIAHISSGGITASISEASGIEMALMDVLSKTANFQMELDISCFVYTDQQKDVPTGLLTALAERNIDIAIGTISPTIVNHQKFDYSVQYAQDMSTWVVPADKMLPHWVNVVMVFHWTVFAGAFLLLLFLSFSTSRIVKYCASNFKNEHKCYKRSGTFFFITVGMMLANVPGKFPKTKFLKVNLALWTVFSFYWNSAFNAALMSVITSNVYQEGIETEEHMASQGLKLRANNRTMTYMHRLMGEDDHCQSLSTVNVCYDVEQCLANASESRDTGLAMSRKYYEFIKRKYRDDRGNFQFKTLKSNIVTVPIEMLLSKGNPLLSRINRILLCIVESGLIEYWTDTITNLQTALEAKMTYRTEKILTLDNLWGAFLLWFIGIGVSGLSFANEILYRQFRRMK